MKRIHIILLSAAMLLSIGASAQSFRSGYFLDNYVYGYRINPAQVNDKGFGSLLLGNIDLSSASSMGVSSFLFPTADGKGLVTGLNGAVSRDTFLGKLKQNNFISLDGSINVFTIGIANGESQHTLELNARLMNSENLPFEMFSLLKSGAAGTYDLGRLYFDATALADLCYGFSTNVTDFLSVGGRLHLMVGVANVNFINDGSSVVLSDEKIYAGEYAYLDASGLLSFNTDAEGNIDLNTLNVKGSPIGGFGAALDLGVQYKSNFGLEAMFSINDLGAISWENKLHAHVHGAVEYTGLFDENGTLTTDLEDLMDLGNAINYRVEKGDRQLRMNPFKVAAGARYHMPFWEGLSVGFLGTVNVAKYTSWYDMRLGATVTPARILSATANIGYGTFGPVWGAALNLRLGPINIVGGFDGYMGPQGKYTLPTAEMPAPLNKLNATLRFPVNSFMENAHIGIGLAF